MSGTGKSSVISNLRERGYEAIDTDYDNWKFFSEPDNEWLLDEQKLTTLLKSSQNITLVISGCCSNQEKLYEHFDYIVLLTATIETIIERVSNRQSNAYGKTPNEKKEIIWNFNNIQPLLMEKADIVLDTQNLSIDKISDTINELIFE